MVRFVVVLCLLALCAAAAYTGWCAWYKNQTWSHWEAYAAHFIQDDGRVVDRTANNRSTSEAQVYSLFFALAANDRERFGAILNWTANNLAGGNLATNLPAWLWGQADDGSWRILDPNPASDADLWLAYSLYEAGRLWELPEYTVLADQVLANVKNQEVVTVPGLGTVLLPAPSGFVKPGEWRLNPSYVPPFQMAYLAARDPAGPWLEIAQNNLRLLEATVRGGVAPDWARYSEQAGFLQDDLLPPVGSYDAIRVYLWAGISDDQGAKDLLGLVSDYTTYLEESNGGPYPPEKINLVDGNVTRTYVPIGFTAALLPYLEAKGLDKQLNIQEKYLESQLINELYGALPAYYDQVLTLFGKGRISGWFRFSESGELMPRWGRKCWG